MNNILKMAAVATFTLTAFSAQAKSAEPAVIYDTAGKFDKSFNEAVFRGGVEAYKKEKNINCKNEAVGFEPPPVDSRTSSLTSRPRTQSARLLTGFIQNRRRG